MTALSTDMTLTDPSGEARALRARLEVRLRRDLPGGSPAACDLRAAVLGTAGDCRPLLILGHPGCDADQVARCINDYSADPVGIFETLSGDADSSHTIQAKLVTCGLLAGCVEEIEPAWRNGGTLFLQRLDRLALPLQKILADALGRRVREGEPSWRTRVRIVAALERSPRQLLESGALRRDLFDALSTTTLPLVPLCDRRSDVAECALRFIESHPGHSGRITSLSDDAVAALERHDWPGDVAELRQVLESAIAIETSNTLSAEALSAWIVPVSPAEGKGRTRREARLEIARHTTAHSEPSITLREMERRLIEAVFARCDGNRERTARSLGIGIRTLSGKLREYGYPPRGGPGSKGTAQTLRRAG